MSRSAGASTVFHSALRARQAPSVQLKVGFILACSFTLTEFALFIDTLRLASDETDRSGRVNADWEVLSNTRHLVTLSCGMRVSPTSSLRDPMEFDYIVVVGGRSSNGQAVDGQTIKYLREAASRGARLTAICTGTFILAEAGLMAPHETCVSCLHYLDFRERFPGLQVQADRIYNLDATRGSCAGGSSTADLAAELVRRHIGEAAERNALEVLQIDRVRNAQWLQPRRPLTLETHDPRLRAAPILMEQNVENLLSVSRLAAVLGISRRQLERLFFRELNSSPALVYRRVRLERAKQLLRTSDTPSIEVAIAAGFENASHFGRVFRTVYGQPPSVWRRSRSMSENAGAANA
ncbi:MAG: GlxA family transcriptional regulator [Mesorhizobium sp.]|nr:GlxA family transcriptional regulator [Mesorhizobium sp. M4A.F.Ca.ET.020.02.1.1]RWC18395.1 MAG: GlxA family transcriptional regulator [Mesorhizobium sp.]RWC27370.1 MAG: GlxA family transcriptional regulator [Mesorhizobium sp.]RWC55871.1 MAG: GlxA family transcriptional regulator [Mesorhizobium sp.]RWD42243.1 MAG: GlxA family transcriptional regulator [Mesorhizobium sp.]